jgi:hypothetical protein
MAERTTALGAARAREAAASSAPALALVDMKTSA